MTEESQFIDAPSNMSMPQATVIPVLLYPEVLAAAVWLCKAFGFTERLRIGAHRVQIDVGNGALVVAQGPASASAEQLACSSVMVRVRNANLHCESAREAGAKILNEPTSQAYGERQYSAVDLAGRVWTFSETEANVEPSNWGGTLVKSAENAA